MIEFFARHPTAANILMIAILAIGFVIAPTLQRSTFPRIEANSVSITVPYPGASPEQVEEGVCRRIEDAVDSVDGVAEISCEARESVATAIVEMEEGGNLDRFFSDLKVEIDAISDFPDEAEDPTMVQLGRTDFVASIAVTAPATRPELLSYAEEIKDRMKLFGGIPKIEINGFSDRQYRIEIEDAILRQYGVSLSSVASTIQRQSIDLPAGSILASDGEILLRVDDERKTIDALRSLVIVTSNSGAQIRLGDIAKIENRFEKDEVKTLFNGKPAAIINVIKSENDDALDVVERIEAFLELERQRAPPGVTFEIAGDVSSIISDRLNLLLTNGAQGLALVCLTTWFFFGFRYAFWITMGLPVAFMGGLAAMAVIGYTVNMITMVGLLIVIGLLMDDAIVISENIAKKREAGASPSEAAITGAREVMPGVLSSFLTTFCVFGSLAFLEGNIGQILRVVPVVMILVLAVSLVEAFLILPHHLGHSLAKSQQTGLGRVQQFSGWLLNTMRDRIIGPFAKLVVRARYFTAGATIAMLVVAISMMASGILKFTPFPDLEGDTLEARILLPQGTPLERTEAVVARVQAAIDAIDQRLTPEQPGGAPLVRSRTIKYNENSDANESGPHVATMSIDLLPSQTRTHNLDQILALWREEIGTVPDVISLKFTEPSIGPAGRAIDIRLTGTDLVELKAASNALQDWLRRYDGAVGIMDDLRVGKPEIRIRIKEEGLALGLRAEDVANQIRAAFFGTTVDEVQVGEQSFEIDARLATSDRNEIATLDNFTIMSPDGSMVPLSSVATLEEDRGYSRLNRINGRRTISVQGDVDARLANASEIINDTRTRFLPELSERFPGVSVNVSGQDSESGKTQSSMLSGFLLGLVGVFLVLSFQFRSYSEPIVVMILIPFALIGAIGGHILLGIDFTMPSMLGFAALAGVVVNESILLVNEIKTNHTPGATIADLAPKASMARFRAILLTSLTTLLGVLPLLSETSLQAQILIPLVTSLGFGLLASTILVLFVVPAFYAILDDFGLTTLAAERRAHRARAHQQTAAAPAE
ncbi:MAG: efflux RND transporter permease subunit [Hyphomicrobiales bacterium]|nr:efflux RND transporter permease subunit [Hyphomicrobiales bacterium]